MKVYDIPMEYGNEKGTLNIGAQADLAAKNHDLWTEWNTLYKRVQRQEQISEIDMGRMFYVAYACAHVSDDSMMSEQDFLHQLSDDREALGNAFQLMFGIQEKKQNFQRHSGKRHMK